MAKKKREQEWPQVRKRKNNGGSVSWLVDLARSGAPRQRKFFKTQAEAEIFAEVGHGNLNWPRIFAAAAKAGTEWVAVEQDICPGDPFLSVKKSYDFLKSKLS